jgi:hypothetical protein
VSRTGAFICRSVTGEGLSPVRRSGVAIRWSPLYKPTPNVNQNQNTGTPPPETVSNEVKEKIGS